MIAPHIAQAMLIKKATDEAVTHYLTNSDEPIEKVEVFQDTVVVKTRSRCLTMNYTMWQGDTLGSWGWDFTSRDIRPLTLVERLKRLIS